MAHKKYKRCNETVVNLSNKSVKCAPFQQEKCVLLGFLVTPRAGKTWETESPSHSCRSVDWIFLENTWVIHIVCL